MCVISGMEFQWFTLESDQIQLSCVPQSPDASVVPQFRTVLAAAGLSRLAALEIWVAFAGHSASDLHLLVLTWMSMSTVL